MSASGPWWAAPLAALVCAGSAAAKAPQTDADPAGFLSRSAIEALSAEVPAAPPVGSLEDVQDRTVSRRLVVLEDSDRWLLATRQADLRPGVALAHFDCALGFRIDAERSPRLVALLARVLRDANDAAERAKARAHRARPVADEPERRSCQVLTPQQRESASYPSGSAAVGAAYGAVMSALAPDRASEALAMGREIGISRLICGMHYPSDVRAGTALGEAVARQILESPAFMADAPTAREEIAAARAAGLTSPACAAERAALATPLP